MITYLQLPAIQVCFLKLVHNVGLHGPLLVLVERVPSNTHHLHTRSWEMTIKKMAAYHIINLTIIHLGKTPVNSSYQSLWQCFNHL